MSEDRRQYLLGKEELTTLEAAELWGVHLQTVWRFLRVGLLEGREISPPGLQRARWLVKTESLKKRMGIDNEQQVPV